MVLEDSPNISERILTLHSNFVIWWLKLSDKYDFIVKIYLNNNFDKNNIIKIKNLR